MMLFCTACVSGPNPKEIKQAEIQYDMGVNELRSGRLRDALRNFLDAAKLNPKFPQAYNGLGIVHYLLNDYPKALENLNQALLLKPDYSEVMNTLGRLYISQGQYREAIPVLKKALEDVFLPERYLAESNLGWALFQTGETAEGMKRAKNALALNDRFCVGYEYLGLMFQTNKDLGQAAEQFRKLIEYCPEFAQGFLDLGKVLLMGGNDIGGCEALETCRQKGGMSAPGQECDRLFRLSCESRSPDSPATSG